MDLPDILDEANKGNASYGITVTLAHVAGSRFSNCRKEARALRRGAACATEEDHYRLPVLPAPQKEV